MARNLNSSCKSFTANAIPDLVPDRDGKPMADLVYTDSTGKAQHNHCRRRKKIGRPPYFSHSIVRMTDSLAVNIYIQGDSLLCDAPFAVIRTGMSDQVQTILPPNVPFRFLPLQLYTFGNTRVVMRKFFDKAKIEARSVAKTEGGENYDALSLQIYFRWKVH